MLCYLFLFSFYFRINVYQKVPSAEPEWTQRSKRSILCQASQTLKPQMQNLVRGVCLVGKDEGKIQPVFSQFTSCLVKWNFKKKGEKRRTEELPIHSINFNSLQNYNVTWKTTWRGIINTTVWRTESNNPTSFRDEATYL